jgi:hypothetical protein
MTNITKLRELLEAGDLDYSDLYDHTLALLDRLEKLEAVARAAQQVEDYTRLTSNHDYICDDTKVLAELEQALAALGETE